MISPSLRAPETIGRARETAFLSNMLARVRTERRPAAVLVEGAAGIGKTRIVEDVLAAQEPGAPAILATHVETVRRPLLGLHLGFDRASRACRESARETLAEITALLGPERAAEKARRFAEIAKLIGRLAERSAVTIAVEDLQWADATTIELLRFLAGQVRAVPLMLLMTARTGGREEWRERFPHAARVQLAPLSSADTLLLLRRTASELRDAPLEALREIGSLAAGNPFYALELLRHRMEGERAMPVTIAAPIRRRYSRLPASARAVVDAAALADTFAIGDLCALSGLDGAGVRRALEAAERAQIVRCRAAAWSFVHAITQAAIRDAIPAERSAPLHRAIAERLESRGDADAARLAHHWRGAGEARRAARFSVTAGDEAIAMSSFSDAIPQYRHALAVDGVDPAERARILERLGFASLVCGRFADAEPELNAALEAYEALGDADGATRVDLHRCRLRHMLTDLDGSNAALEGALARLADRPPSALSMKAWAAAAQNAAYDADRPGMRRALDAAIPSLPFAEETQIGAFHSVASKLTALDGDVDAFRVHASEAVAAAERSRIIEPLVAILANVGSYAPFLGLGGYGREQLERALDLAYEFGLPFHVTGIATQLARFAFLEGRIGDASAALAGALAAQPAHATTMGRLWNAAVGIPIALATADETLLERCTALGAVDEAVGTRNPELVGMAAVAHARLAVHRGDRAGAAALLKRALEAIGTSTMPPFLGAWIAFAGDDETLRAARAHAERAANPAAVAESALLESEDARRRKQRRAAADAAARAAQLYADLGWPAYRAYALDAAGRRGDAVRAMEDRGLRFAPVQGDERDDPFDALTPRERDVARRAAAGLSNREIAAELALSTRTVENYLQSAFERLRVRSRGELRDYVGACARRATGSQT